MKKVVALLPVADFWRPLVVALCGVAVLVGLLTYRLDTLTPGFTAAEQQQRTATTSTKHITDNPLHAHQKIAQLGLHKLNRHGPAAMRLPSALIGIAAIVCMFIVLKNWHTTRVALLGTVLFATSSWLLHVSRLSLADINYVLPLMLLVGGIWLHQGKFMPAAAFLTLAVGLVMLYIPGMIWLLVLVLVWQRRVFKRALRSLNVAQQVFVILLAIAGLAPLIWTFVIHNDLLLVWLGFPANWPTPLEYIKNLVRVPLEIFIRGPGNPVYGIGHLPLVDAFTGFMVVLGFFASLFRIRLDRTRIIIGSGIVGTLFTALAGPVSITFLLPVVYILATAGIALLLQQWFTIFPRNPVARASGVIIVTATIFIASYYHLVHYYVAWPNVPATKQAFNINP